MLDVVTSIANLKQSTPRRSLLIKYKNQPASVAIFDLTSHNIIRRKNNNAATTDEEYLPSAAAFELCGDNRMREGAKHASTIVLTTLQNMFIGEQKKEGFNFQDLKRHVEYVYPNRSLRSHGGVHSFSPRLASKTIRNRHACLRTVFSQG